MSCALSLLVVSGCAAKRAGYTTPEVPLPAAYRPVAPQPIESTETGPTPSIEWWRAFGNAELNALIDRGIANNPDIRIATLKLAQVRERARQAGADKVPALTAGVGESMQAPGGTVGSVPVTTESNKALQRNYQASVRATWRVDLWGEQNALAQSADFQVWQASFERDNVQRNLVASLAANYVEYLALNDRLRIAQEAEKLLQNVLVTIEKRVAADDATLVDLEQQKAAILSVRATIPTLEQQREDALTQIAFLTGTLPESLSLSGGSLDSLLQPTLMAQLPSSLIFRRPDVRMIEAKLLAADADVDVARARLLPPLDLSAQMGYSSLVLSGLFKPIGFFWNTITNLTVSIFDAGKLASQEAQARAAHEEMIETYARALHQAVREVERALSVIRSTGKRLDIQQQATAAAKRAWEISHEIYAMGGIDHQTLLDSGRSYLRHLDDTQTHRMERFRGYIGLFQALGGGAQSSPANPVAEARAVTTVTASDSISTTPGADGVAWPAGKLMDDAAALYWQVELPGLHPRSALAPAWRDLRARYPKLMEGRFVRSRPLGKDDAGDTTSTAPRAYRLYVAQFGTPTEAESLCAALLAHNQRCRVLSSRMDVHAMPKPATASSMATLTAAAPTVAAPPAPEMANARGSVASASASASTSDNSGTAGPAGITGTAGQSAPAAPDTSDTPATPNIKTRKTDAPPALPPTSPPESRPATDERRPYAVQFGAFASLENANHLTAHWYGRGYSLAVIETRDASKGTRYLVRSAGFIRRSGAEALLKKLRSLGEADAFLVKTE